MISRHAVLQKTPPAPALLECCSLLPYCGYLQVLHFFLFFGLRSRSTTLSLSDVFPRFQLEDLIGIEELEEGNISFDFGAT